MGKDLLARHALFGIQSRHWFCIILVDETWIFDDAKS
jgi:hypothetical protein